MATRGTRTATGSQRNVLLVVIDDIGVEWLDVYGIGEEHTTDPAFQYVRAPTLAGLAASGLLFRQGHANPICGPTRSCIQTGRHAFRTGFGENILDPGVPRAFGQRLADAWTWLPEAILQGRPEYACAAIGKWHLCDGWSTVADPALVPPDANLDHAPANGYRYSALHYANQGGAAPWFRVVNGAVDPVGGLRGPFARAVWSPHVHVQDALSWTASQTRPWFVYLAFNPPHAPFTVPPFDALSAATVAELEAAGLQAGDSVGARAGYPEVQLPFRAAMEGVDTVLGELLAGLAPAVRANTLVIVVGDNGTVSNALPPGFAHAKRSVLSGGTRVPLIVAGPEVAAPGTATDALVHVVDLHHTVLDAVGAPPPVSVTDYDSVSFLPVLGGAPGARTRVYVEAFQPWGTTNPAQQTVVQRALFDGRWRYVQMRGTEKLFDNAADPLELADVAAANPALVQQFRREVDDLLGS